MDQVDVVMLTKNSVHILSKCLTSIYENVPLKNLIVIDGFSTDGTLQILDDFNKARGNIVLFQVDGSRAKARTEGIRHVSTEWFLFVDSDVILCKDWFEKAQTDLTSGVAAVWGLNVDVIPNVTDKRVLLLQGILARECFKLRGGTHDTLILTKAVAGISIPEHLHTYEDAYIMGRIKDQGYEVSVASEAYCLHYKPPTSWNVKTGFSQAIVEFKCGLVYSHLYMYMLFYPAFLLNWIFQVPLNWFRNNSKPKVKINQSTIRLPIVFQPKCGKMTPFSERKPSETKD
ncbi:MAG: glycosyltransferase family 2 protein [Candidatus Bathyarchaeia archaeon]|jgi:glycosyltransferase involved in cell wall biosynthesis